MVRHCAIFPAALALLLIGSASAQAVTTTVHDVDAGGPIVAAHQFTFTVTGVGDLLQDVNVRISIAHTYDADLIVSLRSPGGTFVSLFNKVGGAGNNFQDTLFDDSAATAITVGVAPFIGSYRPLSPLSAFNGQDPEGVWTLYITDTYPALDPGYLLGSGDSAPWPQLIGAQLIITSDYSQQVQTQTAANPEPATIALGSMVVAALGAGLRRRHA